MAKKIEKKEKSTKSKVKEIEKDPLKLVAAIVKDLFTLLSLKSSVEVLEDSDNDAILVNITGEEESGLLIGARGKTLSSLQTILGLIFRQKTGEWKRIIVNVSDWREKEEQRLRKLAEETAARVLETGETQQLYNLTPAQRRIVHMVLSENEGIKTESEGEGTDRFLVVSSK